MPTFGEAATGRHHNSAIIASIFGAMRSIVLFTKLMLVAPRYVAGDIKPLAKVSSVRPESVEGRA